MNLCLLCHFCNEQWLLHQTLLTGSYSNRDEFYRWSEINIHRLFTLTFHMIKCELLFVMFPPYITIRFQLSPLKISQKLNMNLHHNFRLKSTIQHSDRCSGWQHRLWSFREVC
jgi:hypothetical protein